MELVLTIAMKNGGHLGCRYLQCGARWLEIFPAGRPVTVDTTVIAGPVSVKSSWYDPTTGRYSIISEGYRHGSPRSAIFAARSFMQCLKVEVVSHKG